VSDPITPGLIAILGGIGVAVLAFIPFIALSYRRRGKATLSRSLAWLALAVYGLAIWTYTLLPLPAADSIRCVEPQFDLLAPIQDILSFDTSSPRAIVTNPAVLQLAFNVLLFAPLGFLVRVLFGKGVLVSTLAGFGVSLAVELTQVTGVWGLYSCAYRFFDVADLGMNTAGAILGSLISLAFVRRRSEPTLAAAPSPVTVGRRLLAILCDVLFLFLVGGFAGALWRSLQLYVVGVPSGQLVSGEDLLFTTVLPLAIQLAVVLRTGATVGEHSVLLRSVDGPLSRVYARPLRFLAGIGGYGILSATSLPFSGMLLGALVVVTAVWLFRPDSGRSFAAFVARSSVVDARTPAGTTTEIRRAGDITPER
jgi:glycopeptide antibiotics resistance protein